MPLAANACLNVVYYSLAVGRRRGKGHSRGFVTVFIHFFFRSYICRFRCSNLISRDVCWAKFYCVPSRDVRAAVFALVFVFYYYYCYKSIVFCFANMRRCGNTVPRGTESIAKRSKSHSEKHTDARTHAAYMSCISKYCV